jgi:hypothetical protein
MRVGARSATSSLSSSSPAGGGSAVGARFTLGTLEEAPRATGAQAAAPAGALAGLLAVQATGDQIERRRRAMRRGRNLLDTLDALKIALLSGRVPAARLATLRAQLRQQAAFDDDPGLADLLAQIELRAEVELAKLARG